MIEGDEKIYCGIVQHPSDVDNANECTGNLLATDSITIVGERVYVDNTDKVATTTDLTHPEDGYCSHRTQVAGAFMTGSDPDGYRMNNVRLKFGGDASNVAEHTRPT